MSEFSLPPNASVLLEATRSIGYTFESALADLIDNSVSANARNIKMKLFHIPPAYIYILDDGEGMSPTALFAAMRFGSRNPKEKRIESDLGRFGLGMKTASISQCRKVTVASINEGCFSCLQWDLNVIGARNDWIIISVSESDAFILPGVNELCQQGKGTLVIWQDLDKFCDDELSMEKTMIKKAEIARAHLELVFHRYIPNNSTYKISISINNIPLASIDPFLLENKLTQRLPEQFVEIENVRMSFQAYILPHMDSISPSDLINLGGIEGLKKNQGFYVYRNNRLIIWGTWFRLVAREELYKLVRIRVDIPNSLDHLWSLDIKKSSASPPEIARKAFSQIIEKTTDMGKRVYAFRGRTIQKLGVQYIWNKTDTRRGIEYTVNREHPVLKLIIENTPDTTEIDHLISLIEESLPIHAIYLDMASDKKMATSESLQIDEEIRDSCMTLFTRMLPCFESTEEKRKFIDNIIMSEPYCQNRDLVEDLYKENENGQQ